MIKGEGTNFNCFDIKTKKTIHGNYLRQLAKERYQQLYVSSPDVESSASTHNRTNNEQRPLSNGSENQETLPEFYDNLKSEAQRCEKKLSETMVFATKNGSEVKEVLSEYGEQLLRYRKTQESAPIMPQSLKKMKNKLDDLYNCFYPRGESDSSLSNGSTNSDNSNKLHQPMLKAKKSRSAEDELTQFRTNVGILCSRIESRDIAQATATKQEISEQIKGLAALKKLTDVQKLIINVWEEFNREVEKTTAKQDGKVNADNPERMSLHLGHLLAEARGKTLTETVNRLHELHGFLTKKIDDDIKKNPAIADIEISNYFKETTSKQIDSLQGPFTKQKLNEILWSYVTSIEDLIELKRHIESKSKNQLQVERVNHDPLHEVETTQQEDIVDKSIQDSDWPPLNAHELKKHYPEDVKLCDVRSVLHNFGKQKLDQPEHDQRLEAIALRATEWLIDHVLDVPSNDAKKELHQKVQELFDQNRKEKATKLFKLLIRQDKKEKQAWITRASHYVANAIPFTHDKLQAAKKELVGILGEYSARYDHINRKSLQFHELRWIEKIGKRGGGYRYEGIHKSEMEQLDKKQEFQESLNKTIEAIKQSCEDKTSELHKELENLKEKIQEKKIEENQIPIEVARVIGQLLIKMDTNQQIAAAVENALLKDLTSVIKDGQEKAGNKANMMMVIQSGVLTEVWGGGLLTTMIKAAMHAATHGVG